MYRDAWLSASINGESIVARLNRVILRSTPINYLAAPFFTTLSPLTLDDRELQNAFEKFNRWRKDRVLTDFRGGGLLSCDVLATNFW
jgi:hypothetical protein